jgi:long-chain acyl-CoA synthetase
VEVRDTIPRQFLACVETYRRADAFRHKQNGAWVDVAHAELLEKVHTLALGLRALNLAKADRVALLSENRLEWTIADLGILLAGGVVVPIYPTLIPSQVEYILRDADVRVVFVSSKLQVAKVAALRPRLPMLERVIAFDDDAVSNGVESFAELMKIGIPMQTATAADDMAGQTSPSDWASIIYTSGTTGEPKGAILTHKNFMTEVRMNLDAFKVNTDDTYLSVLPLSHVFERTVSYVMMTAGAQIAFAEAIETAIVNMGEVHPTIVCLVPRVYEKFYDGIHDTVAKGNAMKRGMFAWGSRVGAAAVNAKLSGRRKNPFLNLQHRIAQKLVFSKIQERVGGKLRFFVSGSAPLARNIIEFFHAAGLPILEGYGLTETAPVVTVNTLEHIRFGTVGRALKGEELRIADDGEILVRGDNVMQGYFKKADDTAAAIIDGWFYTGDIGELDQDGYLSITDRKKDLIATAGGKKMAPQPVENKLRLNPMIAEAVLVGNRRPYITLLILPNYPRLEAWAASGGTNSKDHKALAASPEVHKLYQQAIDEVNSSLAQYERIKSFAILENELTTASGELTPTLKVRRKIVEEKYRDKIDDMYHPKPATSSSSA